MYEFLKKLFKEVDGQPEAITAEELIKRIQADSKLKIVNLEDGGYVAKEKLDAKITELSGVMMPTKKSSPTRIWRSRASRSPQRNGKRSTTPIPRT